MGVKVSEWRRPPCKGSGLMGVSLNYHTPPYKHVARQGRCPVCRWTVGTSATGIIVQHMSTTRKGPAFTESQRVAAGRAEGAEG